MNIVVGYIALAFVSGIHRGMDFYAYFYSERSIHLVYLVVAGTTEAVAPSMLAQTPGYLQVGRADSLTPVIPCA